MKVVKRKVFYDVNTKNASFIKLYKLLKDLGIKKNKFHLTLYDKDLMGVDPHDPDLSIEMKAKIMNEVKINYWYFIREVVKIPVAGGVKSYEIHRGNLAISWCLYNDLKSIIELPRQNYKSISIAIYYLWTFSYGTINSEMMLMNKKFEDSKTNLKRIREIRDKLPAFLQVIDPKDKSNVTEQMSYVTRNVLVAKSTANDVTAADGLGRGCTQPCQWYDEFAFLKYNDIIFASATPANSQASLEAKRNGKPYHICISTTPGDLNTPQGIYAKQFFDNAAKFDEKMYDWTLEEVQTYIKKNSQNDFLYIEFSYKQLGRSEEWFVEQCRALNMDLFKIKREILLQWNKSSDLSPFTEEQIELLYQNIKEPVTTITIDNVYNIQIYKSDFNWHSSLMMGVDVSGGYSLDNSAFTIWDPNSGEIVATFKNNIIDTVEFSELIYKVIKTYFVNTCVIIERNSYGKAVIDMLLKTDIAKNVYFELKKEKAAKRVQDVKKQNFSVSSQNRSYGVNTDNNTRPMMIDLLREIINEEYNKINSKEIVEEIAGLERTKNNKIEHGLTTHDDMLFSFLVLRYVWTYGTNLSKFFINKAKTSNTGNYSLSPQDYMRRIQMVTNLNKNENNKNTMNNSLTSEFIREQRMLEKLNKKADEYEKDAKRRNDDFNKILDLNRKENQKRFDNLYNHFNDRNNNNNFW